MPGSSTVSRNLKLGVVGLFAGSGVLTLVWTWLVPQAGVVRFASIRSAQELIIFAICAVLVVAVFRKVKSRNAWELAFAAGVWLGSWYAFLLVLPIAEASILGACVLAIFVFKPRVWSHNLAFVLGSIGLAFNFAMTFPPDVLLVGLVALTVYDMVLAAPHGPMVELASSLVQRGVIPGIVFVPRKTDLSASVAQPKPDWTLLGAGDLMLPLALVVSASLVSLWYGALVCVGMVIGALLLVRGELFHPRAALPYLALGAAIPFFVLRLLKAI